MTRLVLRPRAQRDIEQIWEYTAATWGVEQAEITIRQIQHSVQTLAADPRRGRACDHIRAGYRKYPVGSHVVFYRIGDTGIEVVRILHQSMDFERHL
jgi:toxin ParE1/3/4